MLMAVLEPLSVITILVMLYLIHTNTLKLLSRKRLTLLLLYSCLGFQVVLGLLVWIDFQWTVSNYGAAFFDTVNLFSVVIVAAAVYIEIEYLKIISVVGYLSVNVLERVQIAFIVFNVLTSVIPIVTFIIYELQMPTTPNNDPIRQWYHISVTVSNCVVFVIEFSQLIYTFLTIRHYANQSTHPKIKKLFSNVTILLSFVLFGDFVGLILSLSHDLLLTFLDGFSFTGAVIIHMIHLPAIALLIHNFNQILLPQLMASAPQVESAFDSSNRTAYESTDTLPHAPPNSVAVESQPRFHFSRFWTRSDMTN
ncbi:hypothetical protein EDD86DRAFT_65458 [Gorgonomyces haynaldii]|nr:hypothetical protein EDD86DRAFT_65458 [Gorgonomyces haynaldii]